MTNRLTKLPSELLFDEALNHWVGTKFSEDPKYMTEHLHEKEKYGYCKYCIIFDNVVQSIKTGLSITEIIIEDELGVIGSYQDTK